MNAEYAELRREFAEVDQSFLCELPAPLQRARRASFSHPGWALRRIQPDWWPLPSMEEVEERLRNYRGFFAHLTQEQIAAMDAYDGPEVLGNPNGPKRTF